MEKLFNLSHFEIEKKIPEKQVRVSRIISLSLIAGSFAFLVIMITLFKNDWFTNVPHVQNDHVTMISYVFLAFLIIGLTAYLIFPKMLLRPQNIQKQFSGNLPQIKKQSSDAEIITLISLDRTDMVIRLAFLNIISLCGIILLFITTIKYSDHIIPLSSLWFLLLPWVFQVIYTFIHYVSKEKMVTRIENIFLLALQEAT